MHGAPPGGGVPSTLRVTPVETHEGVGQLDAVPLVGVGKGLLDVGGGEEDGVDLSFIVHHHQWNHISS